MKPLTPRNLLNHETIDTRKPVKPRNLWNNETINTTKPMKPRNHWHHETYETTKPMKPWNHGHHETYETVKPLTPQNLWNHETIDTCLYQPWNTVFRYILFFFKVISGTQYQSFYKSLAIFVSYEDKRGYSGIPLPLTLTPSMRAGPENMEGWSSCRENNDSLPIQIPRCDTHFS